MPKESPTLYSVPKTFMWFAIVSLILLVSLFWMVMKDHSREWKHWQREFIQLKLEKAKEELHSADEKINREKLENLKKQLDEAAASVQQHKKEYATLQKEIESREVEIVKAKTRHQELKQFQDSYKYFLEEYREHQDPRAEAYEQKLSRLAPQLEQWKVKIEELEKKKEESERAADDFVSKEMSVQKEIEAALQEKSRIEKTLKRLKPTPVKELLDAPMIDFMAPNLRIQQVVLEDLYDDYHFTKVQKVDRCTTCHLGIDQKGFENAPQPFRTHPKLDLFLSASSPHPLEKFGCTVCHGGNGHSVSFADSAHTPRGEEQKKAWAKKYHWHRLEKWESNMLAMNHVEAACAKCHTQTLEIPQAPKLNLGRKLAETHGCFGCHKVAGFENRWKVGPSLENLRSKVDREWVMRWLQNPKGFRGSTKMPQIFHLSNTSSSEDREKNDTVISAIAEYLMKNSESVPLFKPPAKGDPEKGKKLVKEVGCLGCHSANGINASDFAPELSNLGSKVTPEWLYTWIRDPKHYSKDTRMPNLRLSYEEASDIVAYLISEKNTEFENQPVVQAKPEVLDGLVLTNLQKMMRRSEAEAKLAQMTREAKLDYLGKESIAHQGCFACHSIKGFENAKPIGTELNSEGQKALHQFDFGFVHLEHTREAWIFQKLKEPRIFDQGKVKDYYEKLKMPQFNFTDAEAEALTSFVLSLTKEYIPLQMQKRLDLKEKQIEQGRLLVSKFNCQGCHTLDGKIGALTKITEDKGNAPPVLDGEGAKVQEKWLHEFLQKPTTIRPWLTTRMPSFGFSEDETKTLVEYFAYLAHREVSYKGVVLPETAPEKLAAGKFLFDKFQCAKCHQVSEATAALGASFRAPDLVLTKDRLKPDWVTEWLKDPQSLQSGTMMPSFFPEGQTPLTDLLGGDAQQQIEAIRDYLYQYEHQEAKQPSA